MLTSVQFEILSIGGITNEGLDYDFLTGSL